VAAGAVVTLDADEGSLCVGNPAAFRRMYPVPEVAAEPEPWRSA
jgi:acetyltransferase-like isoleucine patch superfamily enzyme